MSTMKKLFDKVLIINREDRKKLFGFTTEKEMISAINDGMTSYDSIIKTLQWYEDVYDVPYWIGDILEDKDKNQWIVTCVYTDNSIDLITRFGDVKRKNCGTISNFFTKIGKIEKIKED